MSENRVMIDEISQFVIGTMSEIDEFRVFPIHELRNVKIGLLRMDSTRKHAVCRYHRGVDKNARNGAIDVRSIDLHPLVLSEEWRSYARYLMFHEYIHALGISNHGARFKRLDSTWPRPEDKNLGLEFHRFASRINFKWTWKCQSCEFSTNRSKRSNGRYLCRNCNRVLVDVPYHSGS